VPTRSIHSAAASGSGFDWARDRGLTDQSECGGDSQSFVEGCKAYASAREEAAREELESDDADE